MTTGDREHADAMLDAIAVIEAYRRGDREGGAAVLGSADPDLLPLAMAGLLLTLAEGRERELAAVLARKRQWALARRGL